MQSCGKNRSLGHTVGRKGTVGYGDRARDPCVMNSEANSCSASTQFLSPSSGSQVLEPPLGSQLVLNCTTVLPSDALCYSTFRWMKDEILLESKSEQSSWINISANQQFLTSILEINITGNEDYGVFSCLIHNKTATFTVNRTDGKLFDAFVSYSSSTNDKKFANFILKPHLENRYGYKLYLDDKNILPSSEPSAELIMNISRCRRLIVVLSLAYLEQDWCSSNFREGLWRLMELSQKPIFIVFESQYKDLAHPVIQLLKQYKRTLCLLLWKSGSMTPSSDFWKELCLALPQRTLYKSNPADPQTQLQEDKDPMLIQSSSRLECSAELDPDGDLGVRETIYKGLSPRLSVVHIPLGANGAFEGLNDHESSEIDISDLGSRNYGARTDFYCLVTKDEM
uniref:Single Ig IL-1-related receptor isoform X3 n=1 Tax=Geotrypetes seraphini TaxID=260995 RepID=A0A6P8P682_GEOSA|nr:single Ig IL-1-related receptor isoform X3 [Geotrypetes seraphini]